MTSGRLLARARVSLTTHLSISRSITFPVKWRGVPIVLLLGMTSLFAGPSFLGNTEHSQPLRESELMAQGRPLPDYDVRREARTEISKDRLPSAASMQKQTGGGTTVKLNALSGGISHLFRLGGYLTSSGPAAPLSVVNQYLAQNVNLFGLSPAAIASFKTTGEDRDAATGVTHLYLQQQFNGLQVFGSSLKGHVDQSGRLISIEANYFPGTTAPNPSTTVSAQDALIAALQATLPDMLAKVAPNQEPAATSPDDDCHCLSPAGPAYRFPAVAQAESGTDRLTIFEKGPFAEPIRVRQVIFPTATGSILAWQVEVHAPSHLASYVLVVDASTKALLYRTNTYRFAGNSKASVFLKNPDATPLSVQNYFGNPAFSPQGWSTGPATMGNNVQSDSATSNGDFIFPFADTWKATGPNNFDRAGQRIRFTPTNTLATGYTVTVSPAGSTAPGATNLLPFFTNTDDGTINLICGGGWTANILGATFTSFWVNTNGSLSFGAGITDPFPSKVSFANDARRVAALWRDLNPGGGGTLTGDCAPEGGGQRIRVVWSGVPDFPASGSQTFAITVHGIGTGLDNIIDIDYGAISATTGTLIGVGGNSGTPFDPKTTGIVSYRDLGSVGAVGIPGGVAQTFPNPDLNLSITNFGYQLNLAHDFFYGLGFTEQAGNYQLFNFNGGGAPLDPVQAEAQYGLGVFNNAFFQFAPDGTPGFTAFGLFSTGGGACRRDSGFDSGVVYHEFTHGVTTRMVGGPQNVSTLSSFQGGALGEGWSDAFAFSISNDPVIGAYTVCNPAGIRSAPYNANPARYDQFGNKDGPFAAGIGQVFEPEVHRDGEIWASALWDVHTVLGEPVTSKVLFEALRYTPQEPSMVDARNAVLLADQVVFNGAHITKLYALFAARGLGVSASSSAGSFDNQPLLDGWESTVFAAFDTPSHPYATVGTTIFFENFDQTPVDWTTAGVDGAGGGPLWHQSNRRVSSVPPPTPTPTPGPSPGAFYYGKEATGNYNTGFRNYGSLISPAIVLPAIGANEALRLEWDQFRETGDSFFFDGGFVRIIEVGPGTRTQVSFVQNTKTSVGNSAFANQRVNLNAFAGKTIQIEFFMDTFDSIANDAEGWYVDNVRITRLGTTNNSPAASSQSVNTNEDTPVAITLSATDPDGDSLTYVTTPPAHGTLSPGPGPNRTYTPTANYNGPDSFTFVANDGTNDSNAATVSITVNPVNDAPSFTKGPDQTVSQNAGAQSVPNWATNISPGPNEAGQSLNFIVTNNNNSFFSVQPAISPAGTLTYAPNSNRSGVATVTVVLMDDGGTANGGQDKSAPQTFTITITPAAQLINVSTRARVEATGGGEVIGGFIITGSVPKKVIIRGLGPSLQNAGLTDFLVNPTLELHPPSGPVVFNQDWRDTQQVAIQQTGLPPSYDVESAIVGTLAPGNYTAILKGLNGGTGLGLIEVYDLDTAAPSKLANLSTRGSVKSGNNVMIGGFFVEAGDSGARIAVRALGPSLSSAGVANALPDPTLELRDGSGTLILANDDWTDNPAQAAEITAASLAPSNAKESAVIKTLPPGAYTAIVQGRNGTPTGIGLVEIYNVP